MQAQQTGRDLPTRLWVLPFRIPYFVLSVNLNVHLADIISDGLLLAAPLKLLQGLQENGLRRRLMIIFSACVVTTIVSLVHATCKWSLLRLDTAAA